MDRFPLRLAMGIGLIALFALPGCDFPAGEPEPPQATQQDRPRRTPRRDPAPAAEPVETPQSADSLVLDFDPSARTDRCHARFTPAGRNRPAVLQITSYAVAAEERFPSFLIWARVEGDAPGDLVGQTASAELYVQLESGGTIWYKPPGGELQLEIVESAAGSLAGTVRGTLRNSETDQPIEMQGEFTASLIDGTED